MNVFSPASSPLISIKKKKKLLDGMDTLTALVLAFSAASRVLLYHTGH